ncbi:MAG: dihydrolipoamide acetyltransferase family protein [Chloroflexota bacterium]
MAHPILMPQLGMIMTEGTVAKWFKEPGAPVAKGEVLFEVSTDKITSDVEATESGLLHVVTPEDAIVPVGGLIGYLLAPGEAAPAAQAAPRAPDAPIPAQVDADIHAIDREGGAPSSPAARKLARERGIDLTQVAGSGPGGRIVETDVLRALEAGPAAAPAAPAPSLLPVRSVVPLTGIRRTIAERMTQSLASGAQFTLHSEADVTELLQRRQLLFKEQGAGRISYTALVIKAVAEALKRHPRLNAHLAGNEIRLLEPVNIGFAAALEEGLVVPVIANADQKPLTAIAVEVEALAEKATSGTLALDDMTGATFTVSVLGLVDGFTPIINPPEVAILGVGRVRERPAAYQGGITVRSFLALSLTVDHRAVDGEPAARFLRRLEQTLTSPGGWMK